MVSIVISQSKLQKAGAFASEAGVWSQLVCEPGGVSQVASFMLMEGKGLLRRVWMRLVIFLSTVEVEDRFFPRTM